MVKRKKSGSNIKTPCPVCGKVMTRAGVIGHMHWKHGKDYKAPLLDLPKPIPYAAAQKKAAAFNALFDKMVDETLIRAFPLIQARRLVRLADSGLSPDKVRDFVQLAVERIAASRKVSFEEAKQLLSEAIGEAKTS
jgi:hypothetical protein